MVYEARKSSVAPAHIAAMANLGEASAGNYDRFNDPAAVVEHIFYGPAQLYMAWLNAILGKR
jgi:hypothetical protein